MQIADLRSFSANSTLETDLLIIGGGPAGLAVAQELFFTPINILIAESGRLEETPEISALNQVESVGEPKSEAQKQKRTAFHSANAPFWSEDQQQFGVRCRVLGGSSHCWAGKSAAFDEIDFAARDWIPHSGWPFDRAKLDPYLDRAAKLLNLGPNCYDDRMWDLIGIEPPGPALDREGLQSFFWQFARSRIDQLDLLRCGPEFLRHKPPNVRVLLNATVTRIDTKSTGDAFQGVEVSTIDGARSQIRAKAAVLAASGIENPRLLLASNHTHPAGLGNQHDLVGRFLMDHPSARLGHFGLADCDAAVKHFGFYGLRHKGRTHMYMRGLAASPELQEREGLLNSAIYMLEDRATDDPWDALKRLLRRETENPLSDVAALAKSPGLLAKGASLRLLQSNALPERLKQTIIDTAIRINPNFAAREFQHRGLPHKLSQLHIDAITEQPPDRESRITLSDKSDPLGVPLPRVNWRIDDRSRWTLMRLGQLMASQSSRLGLPPPRLEEWIVRERPQDAVIIDMAHALGATRMSDDPKRGVVDSKCRVHGVQGLYIAGGSVFPTGGHANPTLMIVALAVRLADQIKADLAVQPGRSASSAVSESETKTPRKQSGMRLGVGAWMRTAPEQA
jgi:choline dehydrogenase-like flavoprotein